MNPPHSPFVGMFTKESKAGASGQWFSNMAVQHNHLGNLGGEIPIPPLSPPSVRLEPLEEGSRH